jgi:hypothetical protein
MKHFCGPQVLGNSLTQHEVWVEWEDGTQEYCCTVMSFRGAKSKVTSQVVQFEAQGGKASIINPAPTCRTDWYLPAKKFKRFFVKEITTTVSNIREVYSVPVRDNVSNPLVICAFSPNLV